MSPVLVAPRLLATRRRLVFVSAVILFSGGLSSRSTQLVLNVNPGTQEFWFTGSDTGTP